MASREGKLFGINEVGEAVCEPLVSLCHVIKWAPTLFPCSRSKMRLRLRDATPGYQRPQVIVCHDMAGGYLNDRFTLGTKEPSYRFYHWHLVDIFIYFSHNFVTIPPLCWMDAAHRHGVQILGTLITEWEKGAELCKEILKSEATIDCFTTQLAKIAQYYGFDGWLVNIENAIEKEHVGPLQRLVQKLTEKCHDLIPGSRVIWYDSVINSGELKWQDELNEKNKMFFDVSDGIFLNYGITKEKLDASCRLASQDKRQYDVFAGIDVYGRQTPGGGGFNCKEDLVMIQSAGLSCAIFAPAWTYEDLCIADFDDNEVMFWGLISEVLPNHPVSLPLSTTFCRGLGQQFYVNGETVTQGSWQNLSLQQVQPSFSQSQFEKYTVTKVPQSVSKHEGSDDGSLHGDQGDENEKVKFTIEADRCLRHPSCPRMELDFTTAYQGGGSMKMSLIPGKSSFTLFKLFQLNITDLCKVKLSMFWKCQDHQLQHIGLVWLCTAHGAPILNVAATSSTLSPNEEHTLASYFSGVVYEETSPTESLKHKFTTMTAVEIQQGWKKSMVDLENVVTVWNSKESLVTLAVFYFNPNEEHDSNVTESFHIGYLHVTEDKVSESQEVEVKDVKILQAKFPSELSEHNCFELTHSPLFEQSSNFVAGDSKCSSETFAKSISSADERKPPSKKSLFSTETQLSLNFTKASDSESLQVSELAEKTSFIYLLTWDFCIPSGIDCCYIYYKTSCGQPHLIGQSSNNCFVWKTDIDDRDILAGRNLFIQPVMSSTGLPWNLLSLEN